MEIRNLLCPAEVFFQGFITLYQGLIRNGFFDRSEVNYVLEDLMRALKSSSAQSEDFESLKRLYDECATALEREIDEYEAAYMVGVDRPA